MSVTAYRQTTEVYLWAAVVGVLTVLLHWRLQWSVEIIWYVVGLAVGLHLLSIMEGILGASPSPLRSVAAQIVLVPVSLFLLTSSAFVLGKGVLLGLNLIFVYLQVGEYKKTGSIASWIRNAGALNAQSTKWYIYGLVALFVFEVILFILV